MKFANTRLDDLTKLELKDSEFNKVRTMLYDYCGINMQEGKEALVKARLLKRIRVLGLGSFRDYFKYIESDNSGGEFLSLVDVLTTNKTSFFRESAHFDFIRTDILPSLTNRSVKWWSAGCSSGEEPISCAITWQEEQEAGMSGNVKIMATDISQPVLQKAKIGEYPAESFRGIPGFVLNKYFDNVSKDSGRYRVKPEIRSMISYGRLNLKEHWPMKGPFHIIMCRNVMIYFNRETQQKLVSRFHSLLEPGGYLFLGHSENISGNNKLFTNIRPAVYQKRKGGF